MLIPFRKLFNQATKAGSSDHLILLPGTKLHSKVGSRQGSKLFLEAGSANRYDAEFPARFSFAPIALIAAVRWAVFGPPCVVCFRARSLRMASEASFLSLPSLRQKDRGQATQTLSLL